MGATTPIATVFILRGDGHGPRLALAGDWVLGVRLPTVEEVFALMARSQLSGKVSLEGDELHRWDSTLMIFSRFR